MKLIFSEDSCRDQALKDPTVPVEWTHHLTPNQELTHLLCKLPQFLKVDVPIWQPAGTALIEEVYVFDKQTEERNHNLLLAAVCRLRPLGGATECSTIVAEII